MLLGCNYSKELIELLQENIVDVDYIKLGLYDIYNEALEVSLSLRPVLLHGLGFNERATMKNIKDVDWKYVNDSIKKFKSPHYGFHLASCIQDWDKDVTEEKIIEYMSETTKAWIDNIKVPFLVENMPYSSVDIKEFGIMDLCVKPHIIKKICDETNAHLLLDIAHAKVTARNSGEDIYSYLEKLPLNRVKEVHIVGTHEIEGIELRDYHLEMEEEDFEVLQWVLSKCSPDIVTLEYGGPGELYSWRSDKKALKNQLIKLMDICTNY